MSGAYESVISPRSRNARLTGDTEYGYQDLQLQVEENSATDQASNHDDRDPLGSLLSPRKTAVFSRSESTGLGDTLFLIWLRVMRMPRRLLIPVGMVLTFVLYVAMHDGKLSDVGQQVRKAGSRGGPQNSSQRPGSEPGYVEFPPMPSQQDTGSDDDISLENTTFTAEWDLAPADIRALSDLRCGKETHAQNIDINYYNLHKDFWPTLNDTDIMRLRREWQAYLLKAPLYDDFKQHYKQDRGIVYLGGNADTLKRLKVSLNMLRLLGCKLPVQVYHLADEVFSDQDQADLAALDAEIVDIGNTSLPYPVYRAEGLAKNFHLKTAALLNAPFANVMYLDSDNIPAQDPTSLFESEPFHRTGAIFWPDSWKTANSNPVWQVLGVPCVDTWEQEAGMLVLNLHRSWTPLLFSYYMSVHHTTWFRLVNGDKDTYQYAWRALGAPFYMTPTWIAAGGNLLTGRFCGHSMIQHGLDGRPMFVHANLVKERKKGWGDSVFEYYQYSDPSRPESDRIAGTWSTRTGIFCTEIIGDDMEGGVRVVPFNEVPGLEGWEAKVKQFGGPQGRG